MSLEETILSYMKIGIPYSMEDLKVEIRLVTGGSDSDIHAAFFPLVSTHQVEFLQNKKVKRLK